MQIVYGRYYTGGTGPLTRNGHETFPCPGSDCLAGPRIQEVSGLPPGTSAPNTVLTARHRPPADRMNRQP
jgi:hypothetical protein